MSRLGKKPIAIPGGVEVKCADSVVSIKGPKGALTQEISSDIKVNIEEKEVVLEATQEGRTARANHGLYRSLISNMVSGVSEGFVKKLELEGVGYRVAEVKNKLTFQLGYCHPIEYYVHPEVKVTLDGNTKITLEGIDKQLIGQVAAEIRGLRKPEPYKGKGVRYSDEVIRKKVGKAAAK
ncbi:MAG: 50S ribosomal protein L6 [Planctomycetes bacterium]|nr:50S ribosomal protein L6 [Planctomycetota bacterium]